MKTLTPEEKAEAFRELAGGVRRKVSGEVRKLKRLLANLDSDLEKHGDPDVWKKYGDLLLASPHARRRGPFVVVTDYFDDASPVLEIEGDENRSLNEIAENYFRRYTKARNAREVIARRRKEVEARLAAEIEELEQVDKAILAEDEEFLRARLAPPPKPIAVTRKKKKDVEFKGARRFVSSDGFEILVGKKAVDNDFLTFRVARSLDTWMHAADYPGSHVVIRNAGKKEIPDKTLLEAAKLAAFYSDARGQTKAAVNFTLRKFVNKPKRSAPGLVSLSSFRTLLVEPEVPNAVTQP